MAFGAPFQLQLFYASMKTEVNPPLFYWLLHQIHKSFIFTLRSEAKSNWNCCSEQVMTSWTVLVLVVITAISPRQQNTVFDTKTVTRALSFCKRSCILQYQFQLYWSVEGEKMALSFTCEASYFLCNFLLFEQFRDFFQFTLSQKCGNCCNRLQTLDLTNKNLRWKVTIIWHF